MKKLIECRENIEQREKFLSHKLKDAKIETRNCSKQEKQKISILVTRCHKLQAMVHSAFQARITIDGYIDSLVTMGVLHETEHLVAASITLSAAEALMSSISNSAADVNEICSVLSEDICETDDTDLLEMLDDLIDEDIKGPELPLPPVTIPQQIQPVSNNERRDKIAIG